VHQKGHSLFLRRDFIRCIYLRIVAADSSDKKLCSSITVTIWT
jgi:hypothetical protein